MEIMQRLGAWYDHISPTLILQTLVENLVLRKLAGRCPLTGMWNRRAFDEHFKEMMGRSLRYGRPLTVVMFDIDHFKLVNDGFGHPAGDVVLKGVAKILQDSLRTNDVVARLGGEEFAAVLDETPSQSAMIPLERIRKKIEDAVFEYISKKTGKPVQIKVTISIGYAVYSPAGLTRFLSKPEQAALCKALLEKADGALYDAKREGRNRIKSSR
jgi:diguanylate cyclase (GGDEF)-like protein